MKLIIMTKATFFVEEDKILTSLFEEGLENLHLYKPGAEPIYSERLLTLLSDIYYRKITVHEQFYLKGEFGLRGIHINTPAAEIPAGYKGDISCTCQTTDQLRDAKKRFDYVFLDGVFSPTSDGEKQKQLREAAKKGLIDRHVYATGNITLDDVRQARDYGFGGVVVGQDLWDRFNIHQEKDFKEVIAYFQKLKKAVG